MKKITINDLAKKLGVTPSTISRALAGNKRVSEKTRTMVVKAAKEMGYRPNIMAASLRKGTSDSIGMIVPRINRHFFSNVISGVEEILNPAGYNLMIIQSGERIEREIKAVESLMENRVGGIIISQSVQTNNFDHLQIVVDHNIPLVQFDRVCNGIKGSKVVNDNFTGGYLAAKHLLKCGFKNIAHFGGSHFLKAYEERKSGFIVAMKEEGIEYCSNLVYENVITRDAGYNLIKKVVRDESIDAVFCAGDYSALGVIDGLKELKVKIPDEFGVVGFSNEPFAALMDPPLSSVEQNGVLMGNSAAMAMIKCLQGNELNEEEVIPVRFIGRGSSWK